MRVVHCKKESFSHYIGRPNILGNPYSIQGDNRSLVLEQYEKYARMNLMEQIAALPENAVLGCWCKPKYDCHGDIIIKLWKEIHGNQTDAE